MTGWGRWVVALGVVAGVIAFVAGCIGMHLRRTRDSRNEAEQLVEAVLLWTGFDSRPTPTANESRLITRFGAARAAELLPRIKELRKDFYESNAQFATGNVSEMGKLASEDFRKKHPGMPETIVEAFAWCYTYDCK